MTLIVVKSLSLRGKTNVLPLFYCGHIITSYIEAIFVNKHRYIDLNRYYPQILIHPVDSCRMFILGCVWFL
jgi:hypothetical protein